MDKTKPVLVTGANGYVASWLVKKSESINFLCQLGDRTMKMGAPKMGFRIVDVRNVANVNFLAGFTPEAKGHYITSAHNFDLLSMALEL